MRDDFYALLRAWLLRFALYCHAIMLLFAAPSAGYTAIALLLLRCAGAMMLTTIYYVLLIRHGARYDVASVFYGMRGGGLRAVRVHTSDSARAWRVAVPDAMSRSVRSENMSFVFRVVMASTANDMPLRFDCVYAFDALSRQDYRCSTFERCLIDYFDDTMARCFALGAERVVV